MKKILFTIAIAAAFVLGSSSCQKDPIGGTQLQDLAGQWYVQCDGVMNDGTVSMDDPFGMGHFMVLTYNTADDNTTDMFIDDLGNFWEFKVQAKGDLSTLTFSADNADNLYYDSKVTVTGGKIVVNGTETPSGQPADYIEFYVVFDDDSYIGTYWDKLKFSGWRYTGFVNDD